jgi:hypothetical protein
MVKIKPLLCEFFNPSSRGRHGIWPTMDHVLEHAPIFLQIYFKKPRKLHHIPFNLSLIQDDICKQQFVNAWKESIEDSSKSQVQGVIEA